MTTYRAGLFVAIAAVTVSVLAGCTGSGASGRSASSGGTATPASSPAAGRHSASQVLDAALAALRAQSSVHVSIVSHAGSMSSVYSDDSGTDSGSQQITVNGTERSTVLLVNGVGYIKGNDLALVNFFGFTQGLAGTLAGRWISFSPGDTAGGTSYSEVTSGITLASLADEIGLTGTLTLTGPTQQAGRSVLAVHGTPAAAGEATPAGTTATLYVPASGTPLPVSFQVNGGAGRETAAFSGWGESLHLSAPSGALAASSIGISTT
jgi:hypothetical protein